ncbi:hypothetical protein [Nonomuraea fuscirosea]|uniref:hypothetical protein n=1 Tax=Nonomuraea fuscirosea TaxID=1291556 RepID=UPI00341CA529
MSSLQGKTAVVTGDSQGILCSRYSPIFLAYSVMSVSVLTLRPAAGGCLVTTQLRFFVAAPSLAVSSRLGVPVSSSLVFEGG